MDDPRLNFAGRTVAQPTFPCGGSTAGPGFAMVPARMMHLAPAKWVADLTLITRPGCSGD